MDTASKYRTRAAVRPGGAARRRTCAALVRPYYATRTWRTGANATRKAFLDAIGTAARAKSHVDVVMFIHGTKNKNHFADGYLTGRQIAAGIASRRSGAR